jgi:hypothetical protein
MRLASVEKKNRENTRNMTGYLATGIFKKKICLKMQKIGQFFIVKLLLKCTKMQEMKPFSCIFLGPFSGSHTPGPKAAHCARGSDKIKLWDLKILLGT